MAQVFRREGGEGVDARAWHMRVRGECSRERAGGRADKASLFFVVFLLGGALAFVSYIAPLATSLLGGPPRGARMPEWSNSAATSFAPLFAAQCPMRRSHPAPVWI